MGEKEEIVVEKNIYKNDKNMGNKGGKRIET